MLQSTPWPPPTPAKRTPDKRTRDRIVALFLAGGGAAIAAGVTAVVLPGAAVFVFGAVWLIAVAWTVR